MDYLFTALIPITLILIILYNCKSNIDQSGFMSKEYTTVLKAACCIIVILVHIPLRMQNALQDAIGSFGYICVTIFFLISAYGMSLNLAHKKGYFNHFWRNRLVTLFVPQLLINISFAFLSNGTSEQEYKFLFHLDNYVAVLIFYCLWFWIVFKGLSLYSLKFANYLLIVGVVFSSLLSYFYMEEDKYWCYERMGLVWGSLLFLLFPKIKKWVNPKVKHIIVYFLISLILGILYLEFKNLFFFGEYLLKIILGVSIILLVFTLSSKLILGNRFINHLGNISYEIYLSHGFIMGLLLNIIPTVSSGIFIILTILFTIIYSSVIHYIGQFLIKKLRVK